MKKTYQAPKLCVHLLNQEDILTLSKSIPGAGAFIDWNSESNGVF